MTLHAGFSKDAVHWDIDEDTIHFECDDPEVGEWGYGYDPRVCKIGEKYYVTWCNGYHGPTIGVAWTEDFKTFSRWRMLSCLTTAMVQCSLAKSMASLPC